jgi:hypothetical protein
VGADGQGGPNGKGRMIGSAIVRRLLTAHLDEVYLNFLVGCLCFSKRSLRAKRSNLQRDCKAFPKVVGDCFVAEFTLSLPKGSSQ